MSNFHFNIRAQAAPMNPEQIAARRAAFAALPPEQQAAQRAQFEATRAAAAALRARIIEFQARRAIGRARIGAA